MFERFFVKLILSRLEYNEVEIVLEIIHSKLNQKKKIFVFYSLEQLTGSSLSSLRISL